MLCAFCDDPGAKVFDRSYLFCISAFLEGTNKQVNDSKEEVEN